MRKQEFQNEQFSHIYNRGVDKRDVFLDSFDYIRFLKSLREFNDVNSYGGFYQRRIANKTSNRGSTSRREVEPQSSVNNELTKIICYCLNKNHYHLVLKQLQEE